MEKLELIQQILELCIIPLLGALTTYIIVWIRGKANNIKAKTDNEFLQNSITILEQIVINAVASTNQTYVEQLKKENSFTLEAQREAFQKTYTTVMATLTEDTKKGLMLMTSDLTGYITDMIEAKINEQKKEG